ncbi:MAG TPA: metalloregulator ArsR/SmtB family transcription factor [Candidatus Acidoferrales bacterium]|jgi:ArsR family transcriptional regulator, virulence genes transcriptional regulator|nr:metalloregulator ArsR/SmtB family transcription factor [Candidatus Acidoferrales bacterium]
MRKPTRDEVFRLHAQFCKALGDANRLLIIVALRDRARTVGEISDAIGAGQSLTSRHLAVLREKGLVRAERDGNFVRYSLADRRILSAIELLLDVLAVQLERQGTHSTVARRLRSVARAS